MRPRTILHTIETGGPGGAETILLELVSRLDPQRYRSLVLLPRDRWLPQKLQERKIPVVLTEAGLSGSGLVRTMMRLLRQHEVDLIHSHLPDQNFYSCVAGGLLRRKVVVTYHGLPDVSASWRTSAKLWLVGRLAHAVVAVSDHLARMLEQASFPRHKLVRIYNGIDSSRFTGAGSGRLRAEVACANGAKLVGMVANLRVSKSYEDLVRAARKVVDELPGTRFVAVGEIDPMIAERLHSLIEQLSLKDSFRLLGFREDVPEILGDLDIFALSSVSEGFSLATIEAMAAGKAVVVTRSGGPEEIVSDGETGVLTAPSDPEGLASCILDLLRDPERAAALGRRAQALVARSFSLTQMTEEYQRLYEGCLAAP